MRVLGWIFVIPGWIGLLWIDVLSTIWLYQENGLLWVVVCWVTFVPLLVIPFLAGYGVLYAIFLGVAIAGWLLIGASEERELRRS